MQFKETHKENTPSNKTEALAKSINMHIWATGSINMYIWATGILCL